MREIRGVQKFSRSTFNPCRWLLASFVGCACFAQCARGNSIVVWGSDSGQTNFPASLTNVVEVAAGALHNLALLDDGTVRSWGSQTNVPAGLSNVVAISAGGFASLALKANGTLVSWGTSSWGQTNVPASATNVIAISVGSGHCLALRNDGSVLAWGANNFSQTNVPAFSTHVVTISAGGAHSVALQRDGAVVCWGRNAFGQVSPLPSNVSNIVMVSAGGEHTLALHADGSHSYWGAVINQPAPGYSNAPTAFSNVVSVSAGSAHTASLLSDGTVHTDGFPPATHQPASLLNVVGLAAAQGNLFPLFGGISFQGGQHSVALVGDGAIRAPAVPRQHSLTPGAFLILNPMATGPQPLRYQWRLNDNDIPNATGPRFVIPKANRRSAGVYSVIISNASEVITSQVAQVAVTVRQQLQNEGGGRLWTFHSLLRRRRWNGIDSRRSLALFLGSEFRLRELDSARHYPVAHQRFDAFLG